MKMILLFVLLCRLSLLQAQDLRLKLFEGITLLKKDEQFRHAIMGLYVVESKTGKVIFEDNAQVGLAPASCQKIITSATVFELLGKKFTYKTRLVHSGSKNGNQLNGNLYLLGAGDPSLGSNRWGKTGAQQVINTITSAVTTAGIKKVNGNFWGYAPAWGSNNLPGGWVWEDIGNYYGAASTGLTWSENKYDLLLKSGIPGTKVQITGTRPSLIDVELISELRAGAKGSGDNAYIYLPLFAKKGYVRGTIPANENSFIVSGSLPDPTKQLMYTLDIAFKSNGITTVSTAPYPDSLSGKPLPVVTNLLTIESPPLDSLNYLFLKKSINLYGEAFVKTIASQQIQTASTDSGIAIIKNFWSARGIEKSALKIIDGSGLSPANRVTAEALVSILQHAAKQVWFSSFLFALPEINGIKMKDGYIGGVRSYAGYVKSKSGVEYSFAFIVNDFDGSPGMVRTKIWKLLDLLK